MVLSHQMALLLLLLLVLWRVWLLSIMDIFLGIHGRHIMTL